MFKCRLGSGVSKAEPFWTRHPGIRSSCWTGFGSSASEIAMPWDATAYVAPGPCRFARAPPFINACSTLSRSTHLKCSPGSSACRRRRINDCVMIEAGRVEYETGTQIKYAEYLNHPSYGMAKRVVPFNDNGRDMYYSLDVYTCNNFGPARTVVVPIMPVGVGLTGEFFARLIGCYIAKQRQKQDFPVDFLVPDLMGCGDSFAAESQPWTVEDWARQIQHVVETQVETQGAKVILLTQGASFGVGLLAAKYLQNSSKKADGLLVSNPPPSVYSIAPRGALARKLTWAILSGPIGSLLFSSLFGKRSFLFSFSAKNLFSQERNVDAEWLDPLVAEVTQNPKSRYAVFSFLSGFWERDYRPMMKELTSTSVWIAAPAEGAKLIGSSTTNTLLRRNMKKSTEKETVQQRTRFYEELFPRLFASTRVFANSNVLPFECAEGISEMIADYARLLHLRSDSVT
ncbi:hypothetical protein FVE85_6652 [Porphyridium purpureum]|uniref:AB hydrolase-1 domain-containing protein n=1 Tax=Porphyridium purpureum TaxID=35688 RepID=A0A5J4Z8T1_PORPP|nr:hypothetical protein FVE85_6652 [Porphyridium purpureum]|eukprot:POR0433..scf295_1